MAVENQSPRRSFALGVVNGFLTQGGLAFYDLDTVIPAFVFSLATLSTRNLWVGAASALFAIGWQWPQLFTAHFVESRKTAMQYYHLSVAGRTVALIGFLLALGFCGADHPQLLLWSLIAFMAVFASSGGFGMIAFVEVVGKTVPPTRRGAYFGIRRFIGGMLTVGAGIMIKTVLDSPESLPFPRNFLLLFVVGAALSVVGMIAFSLVEEPPRTELRREIGFLQFLRRGLRILRHDANVQRFVAVVYLTRFALLVGPFYTIFAQHSLRVSLSTAGIFLAIFSGASMLSNLAWARMSDRQGNRRVIVWSALLFLATPVIAVTARFIPDAALVEVGGWSMRVNLAYYCVLYAVNGAVSSGRGIGFLNYQIEAAPERRRPTYFSLQSTLVAPSCLLPIAVGYFLDRTDAYVAVFAAAFVTALAAALLAQRLREPREERGGGAT